MFFRNIILVQSMFIFSCQISSVLKVIIMKFHLIREDFLTILKLKALQPWKCWKSDWNFQSWSFLKKARNCVDVFQKRLFKNCFLYFKKREVLVFWDYRDTNIYIYCPTLFKKHLSCFAFAEVGQNHIFKVDLWYSFMEQ